MLKKSITYTDFNGDTTTEDFYFNLTKGEMTEMQVASQHRDASGNVVGGLDERLSNVSKGGSGAETIELFKELIKKSFGRRSEDGRRFSKKDDFWDEFVEIGAYDSLFMEIMTTPDAAVDFIQGLLPQDLATSESFQEAVKDARAEVGVVEPKVEIEAAGSEVDNVTVTESEHGGGPSKEAIAQWLRENPEALTDNKGDLA